MKEIVLTRNKIAIVDDEDFERLNQFKWCAVLGHLTWYARRSVWIDGKTIKIYMHREVMHAPKGVKVDHESGNGLDNQKANLRLCTNTQNMQNQKNPHRDNRLGIKGVRWHKKDKGFQSRIKVNGKVIYLGNFKVLGDADSAYRIAEERYFGMFARQ